MDSQSDSSIDDLHKLLEHVIKNAYKARDSDVKGESILTNCLKLFAKDYKYSIISNSNGELCNHYPTNVVLLEYELMDTEKPCNDNVQSLYDLPTLQDLFNKARLARCRGRFACPVIMYEGKHICRSATISGGVEIYGRSGFDMFFTGGESIPGGAPATPESSNEWQLFNRIRGQDIKLLKTFGVRHIVDLMLEKKKVKFGMNVTSSEKVDKEHRYSDFEILSVPYPGCEFFSEWRENGYMAEGMLFDWKQGHVDATLEIPDHLMMPTNIEWSQYRHWDLVKLTQNYLLLLLHNVKNTDSGLLVHCISGWDRTPLFVSLLRLSLWADGLAHKNLGPAEIVYLTVAYDWFLFGHNFPDRIAKGEDIFFFCFNFLRYIISDEFSSKKRQRRPSRQMKRTESECNIDGVLLEPDLVRCSYGRGSNTSISSCSSLNSTRSSMDAPPQYFSTTTEDTSANGNGNSNHASHANGHHQSSPLPHEAPHSNKTPCPSSHNTYTPCTNHQYSTGSHIPTSSTVNSHPVHNQGSPSSIPMAVPHTVHPCRNLQDNRANSPACGSWQIISGTGSFRGSTSSYESPFSSVSASPHNADPSTDPTHSNRRQKLDAARRIFLNAYTSLLDFGPGQSSISGLLDSFAEKVGMRAARSTPV